MGTSLYAAYLDNKLTKHQGELPLNMSKIIFFLMTRAFSTLGPRCCGITTSFSANKLDPQIYESGMKVEITVKVNIIWTRGCDAKSGRNKSSRAGWKAGEKISFSLFD